jgi:hypothetical protein
MDTNRGDPSQILSAPPITENESHIMIINHRLQPHSAREG